MPWRIVELEFWKKNQVQQGNDAFQLIVFICGVLIF
jgi:hypothetical protein